MQITKCYSEDNNHGDTSNGKHTPRQASLNSAIRLKGVQGEARYQASRHLDILSTKADYSHESENIARARARLSKKTLEHKWRLGFRKCASRVRQTQPHAEHNVHIPNVR